MFTGRGNKKESVTVCLSVIQLYFLNFSPSDGQKVTDKYILDIARRLPADRWRHLHVALCIEYCTAEGIRDKYRDITDGYVHLLHKWRAASTRTRNDLEAILKEVEAGGLVNNNEPPK